MKIKKVLKFAIPAVGVATLGISLPLALTSCGKSNTSNIQIQTNFRPTVYFTKTRGIVLKVNGSIDGSSSGLGYKWYYKDNNPNAQDNSPNNNPAPIVDGFKPISDQANDPNQLTIPADKLLNTNLSFKCAVYNLNDHSDFTWTTATTPIEATVVPFDSVKLTQYIQQLPPSDLIDAFSDSTSSINTIINANCGLSANQIESVQVKQIEPESSFSALNGVNDTNQQLNITINLNDAYQFSDGSRSSTISNVKTQIIYSSINQNNLNSAITQLETTDKTFDKVLDQFSTLANVQSFFKTNPNIGIDPTKIQQSSAKEVDENDGYRHISLSLGLITGYYINGKSNITLDLKTNFMVASVADYFIVNDSGVITGLTPEAKQQSSLIIPSYSYLTGIGASAFSLATTHDYPNLPTNEENKTLTSVIFEGNNIKTIGEGAFDGCVNLTSINLPTSITSIGDYAFKQTGLTNVVIPNSVTNIGVRAFYKCNNLTELSFSGAVSSSLKLGEACFGVNPKLQTVKLPQGLTSLPKWALNYNNAMTNISFPSTLTSIGEAAIAENTVLKSVDLSNTQVTELQPGAFSRNPALVDIKLPNTLQQIGINAFWKCTALTSIDIPASVQTISTLGAAVNHVNGAFTECTSLTTVNFLSGYLNPEAKDTTSSTSIPNLTLGQYTFSGCSSLQTITLPANVTTMESQVFNNCKSLKTVNIQNTGTNFNPWALAFYNIGSSSLTINVPNETVKNKIETVCKDHMSNATVTYPGESKESEKPTSGK